MGLGIEALPQDEWDRLQREGVGKEFANSDPEGGSVWARILKGARQGAEVALPRSGIAGLASFLMPQDPGELALGMAMGPGGMTVRRAIMAGLGGMTTDPADAEAGLFARAARIGELPRSRGLSRAWREVEKGGQPRVAEAVDNPTPQHYLDNMRNVMEMPSPNYRFFEDPLEAARGNREPPWMVALNPQRALPSRDLRHAWNDATYGIGRRNVPLNEFVGNEDVLQMYPELRNWSAHVRNTPMPGGHILPGQQRMNLDYGDWPMHLGSLFGEEMQHTLQALDGRLPPRGSIMSDTYRTFPELRQATDRVGAALNDPSVTNTHLSNRLREMQYYAQYRTDPMEWEAGLASARAQTRNANPYRIDNVIPNNLYWRLFSPEVDGFRYPAP